MRNQATLKNISFIAILFLFCFVYYHSVINRIPFGVHSWAQSDRYALAVNYYDSGMDFFHPRTYNMMPKDRIVGVEFPILAYITAVMGHIFGRHNLPACNRLLDITIVAIGLFCIYLAGLKLTKNAVLAAFTPLFIFCSPVFVFYTGSFVPDPVAVGIFFIGLYFYISFIKEHSLKNFYIAVAFMLLAALVKSTIVFFLAAILLFELLRTLKANKGNLKQVVPVIVAGLISVLTVACWFLYTRHLNKEYGSTVFMAKIVPFQSWKEFLYFMGMGGNFHKTTIKAVLFEYMVPPQYPLFALLLVVGGYLSLKLKNGSLPLLTACFFGASMLGFGLFGGQLFVHDYYEIAIFTPFIAMASLCCMQLIAEKRLLQKTSSKKELPILSVSVVLVITICFLFAVRKTNGRFSPDYPPFNYHDNEGWMRNAETFLNKNKVTASVPIAVLGVEAPNLSFTYFDRKGINISKDSSGYDNVATERLMTERNIKFLVANTGVAAEYQKANPGYFKDFTLVDTLETKKLYILSGMH